MLATLLLAASLTLPDGNLLLGREAQGRGLSRAPAATDGLLAPEDASAASAEAAVRAVRLADPDAYLVVDLGSPRPVRDVVPGVQSCIVENSRDGSGARNPTPRLNNVASFCRYLGCVP